jgi:hypothetical protein
MLTSSVAMGLATVPLPAARTGHFYLAQTGHFHVAATSRRPRTTVLSTATRSELPWFHGNCRVDADCGAGGYCSPSRGRCGVFNGFYCHTSADTCVDPTLDCGSCGISCVYTPTVGAFVCGGVVCNG